MRRRDFLKGIAAFCAAAALPGTLIAGRPTGGTSTCFYLVDGRFVSDAEIDENAFYALREMLCEAGRKLPDSVIEGAIDKVLYDRIIRHVSRMDRTCGESRYADVMQGRRWPIAMNGIVVVCDEVMEYRPGQGHNVHLIEKSYRQKPQRASRAWELYAASWYEWISPATLTAQREQSVGYSDPRRPK